MDLNILTREELISLLEEKEKIEHENTIEILINELLECPDYDFISEFESEIDDMTTELSSLQSDEIDNGREISHIEYTLKNSKAKFKSLLNDMVHTYTKKFEDSMDKYNNLNKEARPEISFESFYEWECFYRNYSSYENFFDVISKTVDENNFADFYDYLKTFKSFKSGCKYVSYLSDLLNNKYRSTKSSETFLLFMNKIYEDQDIPQDKKDVFAKKLAFNFYLNKGHSKPDLSVILFQKSHFQESDIQWDKILDNMADKRSDLYSGKRNILDAEKSDTLLNKTLSPLYQAGILNQWIKNTGYTSIIKPDMDKFFIPEDHRFPHIRNEEYEGYQKLITNKEFCFGHFMDMYRHHPLENNYFQALFQVLLEKNILHDMPDYHDKNDIKKSQRL